MNAGLECGRLDRSLRSPLNLPIQMNPMRIHSKLLLCFFLVALATGCVSLNGAESANAHEWEILFDGKSIEKWRGYKRDAFPAKTWEIKDGCLKAIPGDDGVDLVTKEQYGDFELRLEWKVAPGANSGILYHASEATDEPWQTGPEMQVLDDDKHADGQDPLTSAGSLYALIAPKNKKLKPVGEWNEARIIVRGNHVEHWLNGLKIVEYELGSPELNKLIAASKFKDWPRFGKEKSGHIVLQHHHDEVWYRNIRVRRL
jgi:3-keto-disaccharide hydrolase